MTSRPWHANYPVGVPTEAPINPADTLISLFERSFASYRDLPAYSCGGVSLSYRDLDRLSQAFGAYLQARGLRAGDRVALMLPNCLVYPIALIGAVRAGFTVVNVNPQYTARELAHQLSDSGAVAIVAGHSALPMLAHARQEAPLQHCISAGPDELFPDEPTWQRRSADTPGAVSFSEALATGQDLAFTCPQLTSAHTAFLQYTGGTTGVSKGAVLSHANIVANSVQLLTWLDGIFPAGKCSCITPLPLYHIYPLNVAILLFLRGGENRLVPNPRDADALCAEFRRAPFSMLIGVNTLFSSLLASGRLDLNTFAGTGTVIGAGASIQQSVAQRWKAATGVSIQEGYGLTECSPCVCFNVPGGSKWTGSIGVPLPSTEVKLIRPDGIDANPGEAGELCVTGPQVFSGYWQRPDETAKVFTADGWFRTGDVATMDAAGNFYIVDRLKDMILVSGFNVYPNEIEAVVSAMSGVLECSCIGVPDDRSGEVPHLFVVAREPTLTADAIDAHCRANLTGYKVPRHYSFVDALPKSAVGKILRKDLRAGSPTAVG